MFISDLLKDKRIFITGGGTGLGKNMARRFLMITRAGGAARSGWGWNAIPARIG